MLVDELKTINSSTMSAEALFAQLDKDGNGNVSKEEFAQMYKGIKQVVASEEDAAKQQEEKLARSQRRSRFLFALVLFAVPVILVLLAGNAAMVYMVGRLTRETQVNKGGEMVAMDATPIQTAKASYAGDIFDIARTAAIDMESDEAVGFLQGIKSVTYGDPLSSDPNAAVVAEVTAKAPRPSRPVR